MAAGKLRRYLLINLLMALGLSACVYDPYYSGPPPAHHYYPYYYPYYYDYYFYPSVRVYFQFSTGYYFYYYRDRWIRTKVLPSYIHLTPWERATIRLNSDKPYLKYKEHVTKYPPKPRPPGYRAPSVKPAPDSVWDRAKQPPAPRVVPPAARPGTKPAPGTVWDRAKQPPASRPVPSVPSKEREHNTRIYHEHQEKQKEYEKEWEKSDKAYRRR